MPLSAEQKKKLEKLSIQKEGLDFVHRSTRATSVPTIIISLGGLGGETLNILKGKFIRNVGTSDHIYFLAIDSNAAVDLKRFSKSQSESGNLEDNEVFSIYESSISNLLMNHGINRPPYTYEWMVKNFPETKLDDKGAQATRQIGRTMLTCGSAYERLKNKLLNIVSEINGAYPGISIQVLVVAGISGGTGSGTIVDTSYLVHRVMETQHIINYDVNAFIYTPDVQFDEVGIRGKEPVINNLSRNGYAALKEIDYFMNLTNHGGYYNINVGGAGEWKCASNIYTTCTIVSGKLQAGTNSKMDVINNLTENILDMLTDIQMGSGVDAQQYSQSVLSNRRTMLSAWYGSTGRDPKLYPKAGNYVYQMLGYSAVSIPRDEIIAYCVNELFKAVYAEWRNLDALDRQTVERVLNIAQVSDLGTLVNLTLMLNEANPVNPTPMLTENEFPTKKEVKSNMDHTMEDARALAQDEAAKVNNEVFKSKLRSRLLQDLNGLIDKAFDTYGPYYTVDLLTHKVATPMPQGSKREPFSGVLERLAELRAELRENENACRGAGNNMTNVYQLNALAEDAGGLLAGKDKMRAYVEACCTVASREILNTAIYAVLGEVVDDVIHELISVNNKIWNVYTEVLDEISRILQNDAAYVSDSTRHGNTYTYDIINLYEADSKTEKLQHFLKDFVSPHSVAALKTDFVKSMRDKRQEWTEMNDVAQFDALGEVRSVFNNVINSVLKTDIIEKFVVAAYSPDQLKPEDIDRIWETDETTKDVILTRAAQEIANILRTRGGLMASIDAGYLKENFGEQRIITTLEDTPALSAKIKEQFAGGLISFGDSKGLSKYISSDVVYDVPLYIIEGIQKYDEIYRKNVHSTIGLHMDEVTEDMTRFPQPYLLDCIARKQIDYRDFDDYRILMEVKEQADRAMSYGFIRKADASDHFFTLYNIVKEPDSQEAFAARIREVLSEQSGGDDEEFSLAKTMEEAGYEFEQIPLSLNEHGLEEDDLKGDGRSIPVGDFYKLIRASMRYMSLLKENLGKWAGAEETFNGVKTEFEARQKYASNLRAFANALKTGLIADDPDKKNVMIYTVRGEKDVLVDLRAEDFFDKQFILYNAFREFCGLQERAISEIRQNATRKIREEAESGEAEIIADHVNEILNGEDFLGSAYAKEEINSDAKASALDYTFTDNPEEYATPYKVLRHFYADLAKRLR